MIHIGIKDYVIRIIETNGQTLSSVKRFTERALPAGLVENGKITDEIAFYEFMNTLVKELGLKNHQTRFVVPNALVIMRQIDIPKGINERKEILEYVEMEIGSSIHLPFENPVFDITDMLEDAEQGVAEANQVTLFAAPGEEMHKYTEVFADVSLKPVAADVGMLSSYRFFHEEHQVQQDNVYLMVEFNRTSVYLGIFRGHQLEFLRYQDFDVDLKVHEGDDPNQITWEYVDEEETIQQLIQDQVDELENIMNFYRFSLSNGEHAVTDVVLLGDYPDLRMIYNKMKQQYNIPANILSSNSPQIMDQTVDSAFIPILGLALKGGTKDASRN